MAAPARAHPRKPAVELYGSLSETLSDLCAAAGERGSAGGAPRRWVEQLRAGEAQLREAERAELEDERAPLHPMRVYGELRGMLERDAIVIGDGATSSPTRGG